MFNNYGQSALLAVQDDRIGVSPMDRWKHATERMFPDSDSSQKKSCPKGAFLGLCAAGLVKGVAPGEYTKSRDNKAYAIRAIEHLKVNDGPLEPRALWKEIMQGAKKAHNSQMDVAIALWKEKLIR